MQVDGPQSTFTLTLRNGQQVPAIAGYKNDWYGSNWNSEEPFEWLGPDGEKHKVFSAEQAFMAVKAWLFGDTKTFDAILRVPAPRTKGEWSTCNKAVKDLGRQVAGFEQKVWDAQAVELITQVLVQKFRECPRARAWLRGTGDAYLIEGAAYDPVWGVKLRYDDSRICDQRNWCGTNWLGDCLMNARKELFS